MEAKWSNGGDKSSELGQQALEPPLYPRYTASIPTLCTKTPVMHTFLQKKTKYYMHAQTYAVPYARKTRLVMQYLMHAYWVRAGPARARKNVKSIPTPPVIALLQTAKVRAYAPSDLVGADGAPRDYEFRTKQARWGRLIRRPPCLTVICVPCSFYYFICHPTIADEYGFLSLC